MTETTDPTALAEAKPLKYRKKPIEIEAVQWNGTEERSREIRQWAGAYVAIIDTNHIRHLWDYDAGAYIMPRGKIIHGAPFHERCLIVATLEGEMVARNGDWIIKGVQGEFYPCKPDIFAATYERLEEPEPEAPVALTPADFEMQYDAEHRFPFVESEDATIIAYGHPDPTVLAAQITEYDHLCAGPGHAREGWDTTPADIRQTYAIVVEGGEEWRIRWGQEPDTEGAFAVSVVTR